jgi:hypothetical protein
MTWDKNRFYANFLSQNMNRLIKLAKALSRLGHKKDSLIILKLAAFEKKEIPRSLWSYEIGPYDARPGSPGVITENMSPSIGYHGANNPEFVEEIKRIFSKTPDNWVVIVVDDVLNLYEDIEMPYFKKWLSSRDYPKDSKILVVGSSEFPGDYRSAGWTAHDIIGHTTGKVFLSKEGYSGGGGQWIAERGKEFRANLVSNLMAYLIRNDASVSGAEDSFDKIYDILASIVLGDLDKETALDIAEGEEEEALVNSMFQACEEWVKSIPSDSSRLNVIQPW